MQSVARISSTDLVEAALRMGIQGLLVQELRDEAAYSYVKGLESGHWGMTTTHAESAEDVFGRIAGLVKQHPAGVHRLEQDILATLRRNIHVIVHCAKGVDGDPDLRATPRKSTGSQGCARQAGWEMQRRRGRAT